MYKIKDLKRIARGNLQGNYMELIRAIIICDLIISLVQMPFTMMTSEDDFSTQNLIYYGALLLISILSVVLIAGQYRLHLGIAKNGKLSPLELFTPVRYYSNTFILTELILFALTVVCLLPMMGGMVLIYLTKDITLYAVALCMIVLSLFLVLFLSLNFNLIYLVLNDREDMSALEGFRYTFKLMKGNKRRFLYLNLSFIGMFLLVILSFGIGFFWVQPYMLQTITLFYLDVKGELTEPVAINHYV